MTEIINNNNPRAKSPEIKDAISNEVRDLLKQDKFKVLLEEELLDGANVLTARFVLSIKSNEDGKTNYKARYVIGGHRNRLKPFLFHGAKSLQASSARLLIATAVMFDFMCGHATSS